jgi:hypothetical protein
METTQDRERSPAQLAPSAAELQRAIEVIQAACRNSNMVRHYDHKFEVIAKSVIRMAKWQHETRHDWICLSRKQMQDLFHTAKCVLGGYEGRELDSIREFEARLEKAKP